MPEPDVVGSSSLSIAEILAKLGTDPKTGLNPVQLQERLSKYGPNALAENRKRLWRLCDYCLTSVVQRLVRVL